MKKMLVLASAVLVLAACAERAEDAPMVDSMPAATMDADMDTAGMMADTMMTDTTMADTMMAGDTAHQM